MSEGSRRVLLWVATLVGAALTLLLALVLMTALAAGPVLNLAADAFDTEIDDDAEFEPLSERSQVLAADGATIAVLHDEIDRRVVDLDDIPQEVQQAVLAAEDRRFYEHDGYDVEGIGRALWTNMQAGGIEQGGSTITQQLAKQEFLTEDQTFRRKARELVQAVALEDELGKEALLERYLNRVYFGSGAYGVAAAAEEYFRADLDELTVGEAALLAGLIRSPESLSPRRDAQLAEARRDAVLATMVADGQVSAEEAAAATAEPVEVAPRQDRASDDPFFLEAVKREFVADPAFGEDEAERWEKLYSGGVRVHTTLDPAMQTAAEDALAARFGDEGPTGAIAAVDPRSGQVRALESGADFDEDQFDLTTQGRRQPGSAFKPFVAATALAEGYPPDLGLEGDSPATFDEVAGWGGADGGVRNFGDASHGTFDLDTAMRDSVNTAFAELILALDHEPVIDTARELGVDQRAFGDDDGPAIALGGLGTGVTVLEMASAFGVFGTAGERSEPYLIERVEDADGEVVYEREPDSEQVLQPAVADRMQESLRGVVQAGTGTAAQLPGWPVAGKTGTTQDSADAWFVGTTPVLSAAVWMGHPDAQVPMPGATGGGDAAPVWRDFMAAALEPHAPESFPPVSQSLADITDETVVPDDLRPPPPEPEPTPEDDTDEDDAREEDAPDDDAADDDAPDDDAPDDDAADDDGGDRDPGSDPRFEDWDDADWDDADWDDWDAGGPGED